MASQDGRPIFVGVAAPDAVDRYLAGARVRVESSAVTLGRMPWWVPAGLIALGVGLLAAAIAVLRRIGRERRPSSGWGDAALRRGA